MSGNLDWRSLPDEYTFPSDGAAEVALGLPSGTIASWRHLGRIGPGAGPTPPRRGWQGKLPARPIRMGDLREAMMTYRPRSACAVLSDSDWDLVSVAVQLYAVDATRIERKRCEALLRRIQQRATPEEEPHDDAPL